MDPEERAQIQREVSAQQAIVDEGDREIQELKKTLASKKIQHALDVRKLEILKASLAPISRAPDDILVSIFEALQEPSFCDLDLPTELRSESGTTTSTILSHEDNRIMIISHVNRRWREVALATPSLWSQFTLVLSSTGEQVTSFRLQQMSSALETWLIRSADCALDVTIIGGDSEVPNLRCTQEVKSALESLIFLLCQSSHRWETFSIFLSSSHRFVDPVLQIFRLPGERLPKLKTYYQVAVLVDPGCLPSETQLPFNGPLLTAQNLRALILPPLPGLWSLVPCYPSITHLDMPPNRMGLDCSHQVPGLTSVEILGLLRNSPNLVFCAIAVSKSQLELTAVPTANRIHVAGLKEFHLSWHPPAHGFAAALNLPSLRRLAFSNMVEIPVTTNGFTELITQFGGHIEEFECDPWAFSKSRRVVASYIRCMPRLRKIAVLSKIRPPKGGTPGSHLIDKEAIDLFRELKTGSTFGSEWVCPQLKELECGIISETFTPDAENALLGLLHARCRRKDPLVCHPLPINTPFTIAPPTYLSSLSVRFAGKDTSDIFSGRYRNALNIDRRTVELDLQYKVL